MSANYVDTLRRKKWDLTRKSIKHVYGYDICLNPNDHEVSPSIGATGWYEPHITELFRKLVKRGMTVVDIGANIGWYTLMAAKLVGPTGIIMAYEPEPVNFAILDRSIALNGFSNVKLMRKCVSDADGECILYLSEENPGGHSTIQKVGVQAIKVESVTLDSALCDIDQIDVMKIDIEGGESSALTGATKTLEKTNHLIIEWNRSSWERSESLIDDLFANFKVFELRQSPYITKEISRRKLMDVSRSNLYLRRQLGH